MPQKKCPKRNGSVSASQSKLPYSNLSWVDKHSIFQLFLFLYKKTSDVGLDQKKKNKFYFPVTWWHRRVLLLEICRMQFGFLPDHLPLACQYALRNVVGLAGGRFDSLLQKGKSKEVVSQRVPPGCSWFPELFCTFRPT